MSVSYLHPDIGPSWNLRGAITILLPHARKLDWIASPTSSVVALYIAKPRR